MAAIVVEPRLPASSPAACVELSPRATDSPIHDRALLAYAIEEAALLTGISRSQLYGEIRTGALIARKSRGRTIILHIDLIRYLQALPVIKPRGPASEEIEP